MDHPVVTLTGNSGIAASEIGVGMSRLPPSELLAVLWDDCRRALSTDMRCIALQKDDFFLAEEQVSFLKFQFR